MQICMKFGEKSSKLLAKALENERIAAGLSYAELGRLAHVDSSQVSRVCRGQFTTLSGNVLQICSVLKIDPMSGGQSTGRASMGPEEKLARAATQSVLALWNKSPDGARRVARLLDNIVALASSQKAKHE